MSSQFEDRRGSFKERQDTRPISVGVAEALGWTQLQPCTPLADPAAWCGMPRTPFDPQMFAQCDCGHFQVPPFDMDWGWAGPLIDAFDLNIELGTAVGKDGKSLVRIYRCFYKREGDSAIRFGVGPTRLRAVCAVITYLGKANKADSTEPSRIVMP